MLKGTVFHVAAHMLVAIINSEFRMLACGLEKWLNI